MTLPVWSFSVTITCFFPSLIVVSSVLWIVFPFTVLVTVFLLPEEELEKLEKLKLAPNPPPKLPPKLNPPPKSSPPKKSAKGSLSPKKSLKISLALNEPKSNEKSPPLSYCLLLSLSDKTEYASFIFLNFSSASSLLFGFLSGCHFKASLRYAFLISASVASFLTPNIL